MNRRLAIIGAILKKDVIALAPLTAGAILLPLLQPWFHKLRDWNLPVMPAYLFAGFISILMAISVIQADAAASSRHDWLTRPIRRLDMVLAKALFLLMAVGLPWLGGSFLEMTVYQNLPLAEAVATAAGYGALLMILLPVLAFACLTANLIEALVSIIAVVISVVVLMVGADKLNDTTPGAPFISGRDVEWTAIPALLLTILAASVLVLWLQYGRRRTLTARVTVLGSMITAVIAAALGSMLGMPGVSGAAPAGVALTDNVACILPKLDGQENGDRTGFSPLNQTASRSQDEAASLRQWRDVERKAAGPGPQALVFRTRIVGLPAGWSVITDRLSAAPIQGASAPGGRNWTNNGRPGGLDSAWLLSAAQAQALSRPDAKARLDAQFTVLKPARTWTFPADGKRHNLPGFGWCGADAANPGAVRCTDTWPFAVMTTLRPTKTPGDCTLDCGVVVRNPAWLQLAVPQTYGRGFGINRDDTVTVTTYERAATVKRSVEFTGPRDVCQGPVIPATPSNNERLAAFAPHDADKDGKLNRAEYGQLVRDLGTGGDPDDLFQRRDRNLDGFVSPEEYRPPIG